MPKVFSGNMVIKILVAIYGFRVISQKGSHVKLKKIVSSKTMITIVPLHRELAHGTLRGILRFANIEYDDFINQ